MQRAVLALVLEAHPKSLAIPELARDFEPGEAERAVRDLVSAALLECSGSNVWLSSALAYFERLELP
ncbi:MAG TPA: hypothetical protein VFW48_04255 [Solirubrobacterales bacterium]|nr:hypothetical protein [Solirubrobacterales bacterium]